MFFSGVNITTERINLRPGMEGILPNDIGRLSLHFVRLLIIIGIVVTFIQFIFAGYQWISAGGDAAKTQAARERMLYSVLGVAIASAALVVLVVLNNFFGLGLTIPTNPPPSIQNGSCINPPCDCTTTTCQCGNVSNCLGQCAAINECRTL